MTNSSSRPVSPQRPTRILTGTRPSGVPHLGNYFGAYQPAVNLQNEGKELFFFLADYHALNSPFSAAEIHDQSLIVTATMLAMGLDHDRSVLYTQSHVPEVCELAWILSCQTPYALMLRAHTFKDAQAKQIEINMGVFNYPVLMAADILLFNATHVPVGKDQKQHLEMARDIASHFNHRYGATFVLPEPMIAEDVALIPGTDGEKMSKSKDNIIPVFATDAEWKKACMSIKTDSKGLEDKKDPATCNVFALIKLVEKDSAKVAEIAEKYRDGGFGYGHAKLQLLESIKERFSTARDQYFGWIQRPKDLIEILHAGANRVRPIARATLNGVKEKVGVLG